MSYLIYNVLLSISFFIVLPFLPFLWLSGKRFSSGLAQRLGFYPERVRRRFAVRRPVWIHAASVGEARAAKVLMNGLRKRFPGRNIVVSTFTQTGHDLAHQEAGAEEVVFLPLDLIWAVRRAIAALNPAILVVIETEIWPNLFREAHQRGIPALLVSGRLSERSFRRYAWFGWFFRRAIQYLRVLGMQSDADRVRIIRLGADPARVHITGNLKHAAFVDATVVDNREFADPSTSSADRGRRDQFLWVVGSSHQGEEEIVLAAFACLKRRFPRLRLVLAPRHPQRFHDVEKLLTASEVPFAKKSQMNGKVAFEKDVVILDTIGDLEQYYAAGDFAFVGGSLVDAGGHNLLEPARFRKPVLFGPYTSNFSRLAEELVQKGGGIRVCGCEDLIREITALLAEPEKCKAIGNRAFQVAAQDDGVLSRSVDVVADYLEG
jgi:3-deoxy-D-manno-octulosonic-acid transferase